MGTSHSPVGASRLSVSDHGAFFCGRGPLARRYLQQASLIQASSPLSRADVYLWPAIFSSLPSEVRIPVDHHSATLRRRPPDTCARRGCE